MASPLPDLGLKERVLLWLAHISDREDPGVAATQAGISNATGLSRGHVSRTMAPLVERGLVEEHWARVSGFSRRLKAYRLTSIGAAEQDRIRAALADLEVPVRRGAAAAARMRVQEVLERTHMDLFTLASRIDDAGVVDLDAHAASFGVQRFARDLPDAPRTAHFVGRREELEGLSRWLREGGPLAVLEGPGGVGKSSLAGQVVQDLVQDRHVVWVRVDRWLTSEGLLERLDGLLQRAGRPRRARGKPWDAAEVAGRLRSLPVLVVVDDLQKASPLLREALTTLVRASPGGPAARFLLVGRSAVVAPDLARAALVLRVPPISDESAARLLQATGVPSGQQQDLVEQAQGNVLFLTLLARAARGGGPAKARADLHRWLKADLAQDLPLDHALVLRFAALLRRPFGPGLFAQLDVGTPDAFHALAEASLLVARKDGLFDMHDLVREAVHDGISFAERRTMHERLAAVFRPPRSDRSDVAEYLHHLVQAGQREAAIRWVLRNQTRLMERAHELFRSDQQGPDRPQDGRGERTRSAGTVPSHLG